MAKPAQETSFDVAGAPPLPPSTVYGAAPEPGADASHQRMARVIKILEDENETDLGGAMRLLAVEIASTLSPTANLKDGFSDYRPGNSNNGRIKNLRELSKQIQEAAEMSNRDFLNFDGPRFQYVFREVMLLFRASIIKGGLEPGTADHVLRVFYEEFLSREQRLRQETSKLDPSTMASAFQIEAAPIPDPPPSTPGDPHA
jgi:superfamily I DNA/RNA helicase